MWSVECKQYVITRINLTENLKAINFNAKTVNNLTFFLFIESRFTFDNVYNLIKYFKLRLVILCNAQCSLTNKKSQCYKTVITINEERIPLFYV